MPARPAPEIEEAALVRWLFLESPGRRVLFPQLGIEPWTYSVLQVREPVLEAGSYPGDVDVLVSSVTSAEQSLAIECKRVRVDPVDFYTGQPGKLQDLRKGVAQANGLHAIGFSRAFLAIIVVNDGRERAAFNFIGRGLTSDLVRTIDQFPGRGDLDPAVGLTIIELTQPVDKPIQNAGGGGVRVLRAAKPQAQPAALTSRIRSFMSTIEGTLPRAAT